MQEVPALLTRDALVTHFETLYSFTEANSCPFLKVISGEKDSVNNNNNNNNKKGKKERKKRRVQLKNNSRVSRPSVLDSHD